jgi:hypothetical protein
LSRRRFLEGLGISAALSPLVPILNATGQEGLAPKRLLLVFTPDGIAARSFGNAVDWRPQGSETDFSLHYIHEPLEAFKSKLVIPWGMTLTAKGAGEAHAHGMAGLWTGATLHQPHDDANFDGGNGARTGWGSGPSIDQLVARGYGPNSPYTVAPDDPAQETRYRTVELGVQTGNPTSLTRMIYEGDKQPIHPETNPRAAFDRLFDGVTESTGEPVEVAEVDPTETRIAREQGAIVDLLQTDMERMRTRLGAEEYAKLDAHLEGLLALEQRLNVPTGGSIQTVGCTLPDAPPESGGGGGFGGGFGGGDFQGEITQMMDIVAHSLACDVTRVASLQLSYGFSNVTHTWLGHNSAHHTMSHDGQDRTQELQEIDNWYSQQFAYLLQKMDSIDEGGSTLLDNTLVVWGRELGTTAHEFLRTPSVIAGGGRGALNTGRFLDYDREPSAKLLVSIGQMMGLEIEGVGDIQDNSGPLVGLV